MNAEEALTKLTEMAVYWVYATSLTTDIENGRINDIRKLAKIIRENLKDEANDTSK